MKELFEEQLRDQLYHHEVTPPDQNWEEIQKRIQPSSAFSTGLKNWTKWAAVAILALGTGSAIYLVNDYFSKPETPYAIGVGTGLNTNVLEGDDLAANDSNNKAMDNEEQSSLQNEQMNAVVSGAIVKTESKSNSNNKTQHTEVKVEAQEKTQEKSADELRYADIQLSDIKVKTITNSSSHKVLLSCTNLKGYYDKVVWKIESLNIESEGFEITEKIQNGTFTIELIAYKNDRIENRLQTKINVGGAPYLSDLSYVISPNGDGVKDLYIVDANNVAEGVLKVYKDGELVFEKAELPLIWDGKNQEGMVLEEGIYDVDIELISPDGQVLKTSGKKVKLIK